MSSKSEPFNSRAYIACNVIIRAWRFSFDVKPVDISDYYSMGEIQTKYGISEKALYEVIKRNKIQKHKDGRFVYVLKDNIDSIFN